ncbi:MAG: Trk system potassium transporter TrkA [Synergistetes bacterium]|nr:Trk system potassium transporter TrkA [Synergistota bacterium]MCX8127695.1 Trk system potassium transporter TrkA [Synergistota bacterium]MDW8191390.1 Trk system potassium transporter TrkA [Synergistota bacterium]
MRVIVVGAGEVGFNLAKVLSNEGHDVVVIDKDEKRISDIQERLDVLAIQGSGSQLSVLEEAGVSESDMLIAVTDSDETNIVACLIAKQLGVKRVVARVQTLEYDEPTGMVAQRIGIDLIINPTRVVASEIFHLLQVPPASQVMEFASGRVVVYLLRVSSDAPALGKSLVEISKEIDGTFLVVGIIRGGGAFIPHGRNKIEAGDKVFVVGKREDLYKLSIYLGAEWKKPKKIMLIGGGETTYWLAKMLEEHGFSGLKVISKSAERCGMLADSLSSSLVIQGDGTDLALLKKEGVSEVDGFVSLTQNDEVNLLSVLLAKSQGAKKGIALVKKSDYVKLVDYLEKIDAIVNPRLATASSILKHVWREDILSIALVEEANARVVDVKVGKGARITEGRLRDLPLPEGFLVGAIVRGEDVIIPRGETKLEEGDEAVVFLMGEMIKEIPEWFSERGES